MTTLQFLDYAGAAYVPINPSVIRSRSMAITAGLHALLQRTVFFLGNTKGSVKVLPLIGTSKINQLKNASLAELSLVETVVAGIASDLEIYLRTTTSKLPDDERLGSVTLKIAELSDESITIDVDVSSAAGELATYPYTVATI